MYLHIFAAYLPPPEEKEKKWWIIGVVIGGLILIVAIIWGILFIYYKCTEAPQPYKNRRRVQQMRGDYNEPQLVKYNEKDPRVSIVNLVCFSTCNLLATKLFAGKYFRLHKTSAA